eukprot:3369049-Alexandrium_andersonii.AAC.1
MSASLVGSEMCIRDSPNSGTGGEVSSLAPPFPPSDEAMAAPFCATSGDDAAASGAAVRACAGPGAAVGPEPVGAAPGGG